MHSYPHAEPPINPSPFRAKSLLSATAAALALLLGSLACGGGGGGGTASAPAPPPAPTPTNQAPVFTSAAPTAAKEGHAYAYVIAATDADGDAISYVLIAHPAGATLDAASRTLSWTPTSAQVGVPQAFDVTATDGKGGTTHQTWTVTPSGNAAPGFTTAAPSAARAGLSYIYVVNTTDPDGDAVSLSLVTRPAGATFDPVSRTLAWIPAGDQAGVVQAFDLLATDGMGGTTHQSWSLTPTANAAPAFTSAAPTTAKENHPYTYTVAATDADADTITLSLVTKPAGATFDVPSRTIAWTPSGAQVGVAQAFDVQASDGLGGTTHQTWTVTPTANAAPAFTSAAPTTGTTGSIYTYTPTTTDADGDSVAYSLVSKPTWASLVGNAVTGTPSGSGPAAFTLRADDGHGQTTDQSWSATIIPAGNQAPTFTSTPGTVASGGVAYAYTLVATDPESDAITYQLTSGPTGAVLTGDTLTWTPTAGQERVQASFSVQAQDVWGALSAPQTWTVTPAGTIAGTRFLTDTPLAWGTQVTPDPHADPQTLAALVPDGNGGFTTVSGAFTGGAFTVGPVPGGAFWLQLGADTFAWTDKGQVDLKAYQPGRHGLAFATQPTLVDFTIGSMAAWAAGDIIEYYDWNTRGSVNLSQVTNATNRPTNGDTALTAMTVDYFADNFQGGLVDAAQGDHPLVIHAVPLSIGGQTVYVSQEVAEVTSLQMTDGVAAHVTSTFTKAPAGAPFKPNWTLSAFTGCLSDVSPAATLLDSELVLAGAYDLTHTGLGLGYTVDLVRVSGAATTSDIDLSASSIAYVALPSAPFTPITDVEVAFTRPYTHPAATHPVAMTFWVTAYNSAPSLMDGSQAIVPLVTPATALALNGVACSGDLAPAAAPSYVLSWTAPAMGAKGYRVFLYEFSASGTDTAVDLTASFVTATTSLAFPANLLQSGKQYALRVQAVASPSWDPTSSPLGNIETVAYGYADAVSGLIAMP